MEHRLNMKEHYKEAYQALCQLDDIVARSGVDIRYKELVRIRASQLNGCAYCVDAHTMDALNLGINYKKLSLLSVWREAAGAFSEEEQALLNLTDHLTLVADKGLPESIYQNAIARFGENSTAQIIMLIIVINAWNRIGVGLQLKPTL